ncbi:hypothetical protein [Streptomyces sp. NPDC088794]|uniref:hypothetical protein n=1 Tax=Streptomyces sp. NPDC088794 TaxID=3365902 RepID=UPI00382959B0
MSTPTPDPAGGTPAVPTPAEAVAAGQIPAQTPAPPASPAPPVQPTGNGSPAEPTDWEAEAVKWKALSRQHENKHLAALGFKSKDEIAQLREAAQKQADLEEAQKTELQKATEQAKTYEQQIADMRSTNARLLAAATHNIPPDLIDLLGSGTDEEINTRAGMLAERLKAAVPPAPPASQRPVESLTPGAAPPSAAPADADAWIRKMAGR